MKLSVVSLEYIFPGEDEILCYFFEKGVEYVVMRKPRNTEKDIIHLISRIPSKYHEKIIIQDRFSLLKHFNLNGILLSKRSPKAPVLEKRFSKSVSCSRIEDVIRYQNFYHIFFGPVFDSISKTIKPAFGETALKEAKERNIINDKVIAVGGIDENTIPEAKMFGFEHIAVLGSLWKNYPEEDDKEVLYARFDKLMELAQI